MIYIDFDGVILDTEKLLFEEWRKNPNRYLLSEEDKIKYIQTSDWSYILNNSEIINDSVYYLKQMNPFNSFILTKFHSVANEGAAKIKWIKNMGIKQRIILVPYSLTKTDLVNARNNILIDDSLRNLIDWENHQGMPIFFDINDDNIDSWNETNTNGYPKVLSLKDFTNIKKCK